MAGLCCVQSNNGPGRGGPGAGHRNETNGRHRTRLFEDSGRYQPFTS